MKKTILALLLFGTLILTSACGSKTAENQAQPVPTVVPASEAPAPVPEGSCVFTLQNNIGADIYEVHISPNPLDTFGEDILHDSILKQGEAHSLNFLPEGGYSYWDLRVLTENGNIYTWQNIQFGSFSTLELTMGENGPECSSH